MIVKNEVGYVSVKSFCRDNKCSVTWVYDQAKQGLFNIYKINGLQFLKISELQKKIELADVQQAKRLEKQTDLISIGDACVELHVSRTWIYDMFAKKVLNKYMIGTKTFLKISEIEQSAIKK